MDAPDSSLLWGSGCTNCGSPWPKNWDKSWNFHQRVWWSRPNWRMEGFQCKDLSLEAHPKKFCLCFKVALRQGGPKLKATQVYPKGYGKKLVSLHHEYVVGVPAVTKINLDVLIYVHLCFWIRPKHLPLRKNQWSKPSQLTRLVTWSWCLLIPRYIFYIMIYLMGLLVSRLPS